MKTFALLLSTVLLLTAEGRDLDVRSFGAAGDGMTKDTAAVQRAIDAAAVAGGGRVVLSKGTFLCGTLFLKSNVDLHVDWNAEILASHDRADYNAADVCPQNGASTYDNMSGGHLIMAVCATNIALTGRGTVNGNYPAFFRMPDGSFPPSKKDIPWRPGQMVFLAESKDVRIADVRLVNSPYWSCLLYGCEDVAIDRVAVRTSRRPHVFNGDGIDIDACSRVTVRDCDIETADDSITLRAAGSRLARKANVCEDVTVERCLLASACNAVRLGVGAGTVRNAVFRDCRIHNSRYAVCLVAGYTPKDDGAEIDGVTFDGLTVDARNFIVAYHRYTKGHTFRNITFRRVTGTSDMTSRLYADPRYPFENFTFDEVDMPAGFEAVNLTGLQVRNGRFPRFQTSAERRAALDGQFVKGDFSALFKPIAPGKQW